MAEDRHVRRSGDDYAGALLALLPYGQAWPRDPQSTLVLAVTGIAEYWGWVDGRAADLLETESDPRLTVELLPDWERNWGLPDPCLINPPRDLTSRHKMLVGKMTLLGAQSRAFFIAVALALGYQVTITEYSPYMCGVSRCGNRSKIYNPDDPTRMFWQLGKPEIRYYWTVHVAQVRLVKFHVASSQVGINRLLEIYGPGDLECIFERWKPAHTEIVWDFSPLWSLDYTNPFNTMYLSMGIP
jgi:uncharacterized protein YmfQ (DUF2313 family)